MKPQKIDRGLFSFRRRSVSEPSKKANYKVFTFESHMLCGNVLYGEHNLPSFLLCHGSETKDPPVQAFYVPMQERKATKVLFSESKNQPHSFLGE
ncbi:MAG TPA: hypothetical protein VF173_07085 [Thermoanaerobaculia bacterium]|nr:hypothetical protein [Thermoanaerobaculia bacterium]